MSRASSANLSEEEINALSCQKAYARVYSLLVRSAERRQTVTYGDVAALMGLPPSGQHMARETGRMLGAITHRERGCGRPMLTAVVVSAGDKRPGPGFYGLARQVGGLDIAATKDDEQRFWKEELERVFDEWAQEEPARERG